MANYDVIGNIAIVKFKRGVLGREKKKWAERFLRGQKSVRTILEKSGKFKGRLRIQATKWIAGEKTKEALYKESDCVFRLNVDSCYFSPRLSAERIELARKVRRGERVLVMFGGVAPFAIVIAKHSSPEKVFSVELSRACNKYALENVKRNKLMGRVEIVRGDVRKVIGKGRVRSKKIGHKFEKLDNQSRAVLSHSRFDRIVMARPNLKDSFLDVAFSIVRKGGVIHYYGFTENKKFSVPKTLKGKGRVSGYDEGEEEGKLKKMIVEEAGRAGRKVKILRVKKAGEIGVKRYRYRVDLKVL